MYPRVNTPATSSISNK